MVTKKMVTFIRRYIECNERIERTNSQNVIIMVSFSDVSTVPKIELRDIVACPSHVNKNYLGVNHEKSYHVIL